VEKKRFATGEGKAVGTGKPRKITVRKRLQIEGLGKKGVPNKAEKKGKFLLLEKDLQTKGTWGENPGWGTKRKEG